MSRANPRRRDGRGIAHVAEVGLVWAAFQEANPRQKAASPLTDEETERLRFIVDVM